MTLNIRKFNRILFCNDENRSHRVPKLIYGLFRKQRKQQYPINNTYTMS